MQGLCTLELHIVTGRDPIFFLEHAGKIQRLPEPALSGDFCDVAALMIDRTEIIRGSLQPLVIEVLMGGRSHFLLEQLAEVVIIEGNGTKVAVQFKIGIRKITDECPFNFLDNFTALRNLLIGNQIADNECSIC